MEVGHGYDMAKMDKSFDQNMAAMAKQFGYDMSKISAQQSASINASKADAMAKIQAEEASYQLARERELAKFTPGTPEYKIREAQLKDQRDANVAEIHNKTMYEANSSFILSDPNLVTNPNQIYSGLDMSKPADRATLQLRMDAYSRYNNWLSSNGAVQQQSFNPLTVPQGQTSSGGGNWFSNGLSAGLDIFNFNPFSK
jgi:hypothetical protein